MRRELDAAGITDPQLRAAFETCRRINAAHGRTYYLATLLLPAHKRPYVHALYGFARYADDLIDDPEHPDPGALLAWSNQFLTDLDRGDSADPVAGAVIHTARTWGIPRRHFEAFLASMQADITVTEYATYADLERYMFGSAAVIGLQMLPILGPLTDAATGPAQALGEAFQLTNFIRDVGEDLARGRLYLPREDLARFGVDDVDLKAAAVTGLVSPAVRDLLAFEVARARRRYTAAEPGIALVHPTSRDCLRAAFALYGGILTEVERSGYQVFTARAHVSTPRRLQIALPALARAQAVRLRHRRTAGRVGAPTSRWTPRLPHQTHQDSVCSTSENPNSRSSTGA